VVEGGGDENRLGTIFILTRGENPSPMEDRKFLLLVDLDSRILNLLPEAERPEGDCPVPAIRTDKCPDIDGSGTEPGFRGSREPNGGGLWRRGRV
jgi:hypothetical protein